MGVVQGTHDQIATVSEVESSSALLPSDTLFYSIEGGNHAQFGYYGSQQGDGEPTITRSEQHRIVTERIVESIEK